MYQFIESDFRDHVVVTRPEVCRTVARSRGIRER